MQQRVIVSFGKGLQFDYRIAAGGVEGDALEAGRHWFEHEFKKLGCSVDTPTGKVLMIDRILSVAKTAGEAHFEAQQQWAEQFARYTAAVLGRDLVKVDVSENAIGY